MATTIRDLIPEEAVDRIANRVDDLRGRVVRAMPQERARRARRERTLAFLAGVAVGALVATLARRFESVIRRRPDLSGSISVTAERGFEDGEDLPRLPGEPVSTVPGTRGRLG